MISPIEYLIYGIAVLIAIYVIYKIVEMSINEKNSVIVSEIDELWEVLVPASNHEKEFTYEHHLKWDEYVKSLSGGLTIMKTATGKWVSPDGTLYKDRVIPVKIKCTYDKILKIIEFTIKHYDQEAVMAYKISDEVILIHKNDI